LEGVIDGDLVDLTALTSEEEDDTASVSSTNLDNNIKGVLNSDSEDALSDVSEGLDTTMHNDLEAPHPAITHTSPSLPTTPPTDHSPHGAKRPTHYLTIP